MQGLHFPSPGDLAAIDAKYDAAVSTAVGALDNILVETTSDAQRAVEHLRRSGAGCATFLIAEKQQHLERAAQERVETPEGETGAEGSTLQGVGGRGSLRDMTFPVERVRTAGILDAGDVRHGAGRSPLPKAPSGFRLSPYL